MFTHMYTWCTTSGVKGQCGPGPPQVLRKGNFNWLWLAGITDVCCCFLINDFQSLQRSRGSVQCGSTIKVEKPPVLSSFSKKRPLHITLQTGKPQINQSNLFLNIGTPCISTALAHFSSTTKGSQNQIYSTAMIQRLDISGFSSFCSPPQSIKKRGEPIYTPQKTLFLIIHEME